MFFSIEKVFCTPKRSTQYSAGVDLFSAENKIIKPGNIELIDLGIKINIAILNNYIKHICETKYGVVSSGCIDAYKKNHVLQLNIRSSLALKGLIIPNGVGIIDLDYADPIKLMVYNITNEEKIITAKQKIAQIMMKPHDGDIMNIISEEHRIGGFGSTGE